MKPAEEAMQAFMNRSDVRAWYSEMIIEHAEAMEYREHLVRMQICWENDGCELPGSGEKSLN